MIKTFKTLDEQIEILQNKGLTIDDINYTKETLLRENYFFVNGYRHLFLKSPESRKFIQGTTFRELYALFNFDRQLRNIMFKNILIIENNVKSVIAYNLSKSFGITERNYLNPRTFTSESSKTRQVNDLIKKMKRQIRINGSQHTATAHYITNYGYIPPWIVVKVLSFGIVSEFYSILKLDNQKEIAEIFGVNYQHMPGYLTILSNYRNLCAHEDIVFEHRTQKPIYDTKYHSMLNIPKMDGEYIYGKDDLFSVIIILKQMLRKDDFNLLLREIEYEISVLEGKLRSIPITKVLDKMGFVKNYKEIARL